MRLPNYPLHYDGCKNLWQAVIHMAVRDALGISGYKLDDLTKREALCWLTRKNTGFYFACDAAGYNPERVRERFLKAYEGKKGKRENEH